MVSQCWNEKNDNKHKTYQLRLQQLQPLEQQSTAAMVAVAAVQTEALQGAAAAAEQQLHCRRIDGLCEWR
jgi:hypothetical protein